MGLVLQSLTRHTEAFGFYSERHGLSLEDWHSQSSLGPPCRVWIEGLGQKVLDPWHGWDPRVRAGCMGASGMPVVPWVSMGRT